MYVLEKPKLIKRPTPFMDESLKGYIQRLTVVNGYELSRWIYQDVELVGPFRNPVNLNMIQQKYSLRKLSEYTGVAEEVLSSLTLYNDFGMYYEAEKDVVNSVVNQTIYNHGTQICPGCLKDKKYFRKFWDIKFYTGCHLHNCLLYTKCPECNRSISPYETRINHCICGFGLHRLPQINVSSETLGLSSLIASFFEKSRFQERIEVTNNYLVKLELREVLYILIQFVKLIARYYYGVRYSFHNPDIQPQKLHLMMVKVFSIFSDWPNNFFGFLDEFRKIEKNSSMMSGLKKEFGSFYEWMYKKIDYPFFRFIQSEFEQFVSRYWDGGYVSYISSVITDSELSSQSYVSADEARVILGCDLKKINELIESNQVKGIIQDRKEKKLILVEKSSLLEYKAQSDAEDIKIDEKYFSFAEAQETLKVGYYQVRFLIQGSLIQAVTEHEVNGGGIKWLIERKSIHRIFQRLDDLVVQEEVNIADYLPLYQAIRNVRGNITQLIHDTLLGSIRVIKKGDARGLCNYCFNKSDLFALRMQEDYLFVKDICRVLGSGKDSIHVWIDKGYLKTKLINGINLVSKSSFENFQAKFITMNEISKLTHKKPTYLLSKLEAMKVRPIRSQIEDEGRPYLFIKKEVMKLIDNENWDSRYLFNYEAAALLKVGKIALSSWIKKGLIKTISVGDQELIDAKVLDEFQQEYISMNNLMLITKKTTIYIKRLLDSKGIKPVRVNIEDDGKPYLYYLREAKKVIESSIPNVEITN